MSVTHHSYLKGHIHLKNGFKAVNDKKSTINNLLSELNLS